MKKAEISDLTAQDGADLAQLLSKEGVPGRRVVQ